MDFAVVIKDRLHTLTLSLIVMLGLLAGAKLCFAGDVTANRQAIETDLRQILKRAGRDANQITLDKITLVADSVGARNTAQISCSDDGRVRISIEATPSEWGATLYYALQRLGFLFPHPRMQVSPTTEAMMAACQSTVEWRPRLKHRGMHLHTMHPSEWVHGFFTGEEEIAHDIYRWHARNGQNILQIVLLKTVPRERFGTMDRLFRFGRGLGVRSGIDVTFVMQQQKAYRLVNVKTPLNLLVQRTPVARYLIRREIRRLAKAMSFDFMTIELGATEFNSTPPKITLGWINAARSELLRRKRELFIKIHASSNQVDKKWGNYNFLPQYSPPEVGVLPHTVMFYGLEDLKAPVYGRRDFKDMNTFMQTEKSKRPTWYYPETSYFVAFDIDIPLLLTDYLVARTRDTDLLERSGVDGQLNFTTGQELGYWLFDWNVALSANQDFRGDPLAALRLLGESDAVWRPILDFQTKHFKDRQVIRMLSSANMLDEVPLFGHPVHDRFTFAMLNENRTRAFAEAELLRDALREAPALSGVLNPELRTLLEITHLRIRHALELRNAFLEPKGSARRTLLIDLAKVHRQLARQMIERLIQNTERYPSAKVFDRHANPTSYGFGYGYTARTLHYWKREEEMIRNNRFDAFYRQIINPVSILF